MIKYKFNDFFKKEGLISPFNDYLLLNQFSDEDLPLDDEAMIKRVYTAYDRILNSIILLEKIEQNKEPFLEEFIPIIFMAIHESICFNFIRINSTVQFFLKYAGKESEKDLISDSLEWFNPIEQITSDIINATGSLMAGGGNNEKMQFQLYNNNSNPTLKVEPEFMDGNSLISSIGYFSWLCFTQIKYIEKIMKSLCKDHFSIKNYDLKIKELKTDKNYKEEIIYFYDYENIKLSFQNNCSNLWDEEK